jgi:Domain of unknown function (DUF4172)
MSARYTHELSGGPHFQFRASDLAKPLAVIRHKQGRLVGRMEGLGFNCVPRPTFTPLPKRWSSRAKSKAPRSTGIRCAHRSPGISAWTSAPSALSTALSK